MQEITTTLKMDNIGRVMIPKHIREAMGVAPGDMIELTIRKGISGKSEMQENPIEALALA
jgi:AbrB family looped-hinge helix DNA binding protein